MDSKYPPLPEPPDAALSPGVAWSVVLLLLGTAWAAGGATAAADEELADAAAGGLLASLSSVCR